MSEQPVNDPAEGSINRDDTVLGAVCEAASALLAQAPAPVERLRVQCGEVTVDLRWPAAPLGRGWSSPAPVSPATVLGEEIAEATAELSYIQAPMVGTFYHAPTPGAAPFVRVGEPVEPGQQVGILEAMKLMNPVEAEQGGRVVEILVPDATGVEFDQRLIALAPWEPGETP